MAAIIYAARCEALPAGPNDLIFGLPAPPARAGKALRAMKTSQPLEGLEQERQRSRALRRAELEPFLRKGVFWQVTDG
jgi:hypothetical protein